MCGLVHTRMDVNNNHVQCGVGVHVVCVCLSVLCCVPGHNTVVWHTKNIHQHHTARDNDDRRKHDTPPHTHTTTTRTHPTQTPTPLHCTDIPHPLHTNTDTQHATSHTTKNHNKTPTATDRQTHTRLPLDCDSAQINHPQGQCEIKHLCCDAGSSLTE